MRRNRRRSALLALAGIANAWLVFSLFASIGLWVLVDVLSFNGKGVDAPVLGVFSVALVLGVLPTAAVVAPVLRIRDTTVKGLGAVLPGPGELPRVENLLSELALATGTPTVRAALLADDAPNALAVGLRPRDTTLLVTSGLVEDLTRDELEAVLAALLCSVRRWDTALRTVSVATTSFTGMLYRSSRAEVAGGQHWMYRLNWASWAGVLLTWPSMACGSRVRRSVLRAYDFGADDMAVAVTRHPDALVSALRKLRDDPREVTGLSYRNAPLWFEPVTDDDIASYELRRQAFAPSLDERIARLSRATGAVLPPDGASRAGRA